MPSAEWFFYTSVRKGAILSPQIEGKRATLLDVVAFKAAGMTESSEPADVQEVGNHLDAR